MCSVLEQTGDCKQKVSSMYLCQCRDACCFAFAMATEGSITMRNIISSIDFFIVISLYMRDMVLLLQVASNLLIYIVSLTLLIEAATACCKHRHGIC